MTFSKGGTIRQKATARAWNHADLHLIRLISWLYLSAIHSGSLPLAASFTEMYNITAENAFISYSDTSSIKFYTVAPPLEFLWTPVTSPLVFTPPIIESPFSMILAFWRRDILALIINSCCKTCSGIWRITTFMTPAPSNADPNWNRLWFLIHDWSTFKLLSWRWNHRWFCQYLPWSNLWL